MKTKAETNLPSRDAENNRAVLRLGKDEMNLAEFPITLLTDRVPAGQKSIEYQDQIFDERTGRKITRKLTVKPAEGTGLPTAVDDDVILGLIQLTKANNGFKSRRLEFSRLDLIRMLGWPDSGASYKRLTISLERWLGVSLVYENAWWDKRQQAWTTKGFHIIDNFELNISRGGTGQDDLFPSTILWNQTVFESFESGYLKSIDYEFYIKLGHPTARRMYRFLSKRMYHRPDWVFELKDLAFEHIGLSRNYSGNAGKIKEKLQPAIEELEAAGFLEPSGKGQRYMKEGKIWRIRLVRQVPQIPFQPAAEILPPPVESLIAKLIERGVHHVTAAELVRQHSAEDVRHKLEVFDWLKAKDDKRVARNPAGYLRTSITKDYALPEGFVSPEQRERQQQEKAAKDHRAAEARSREQEIKISERAKRQRDRSYWETLTPEKQVEHQAMADAQVAPGDLAKEVGPLKRMGQHARRMTYVRAMLDLQETSLQGE